MRIETFVAGPAETNGFLVADHADGKALIIDAPQGIAASMVAKARQWNTSVTYLLNTHAHWDHYWDNAEILKLTGAKLGIHAESAPLLKLPQARLWGLDTDIAPSTPDFFLTEETPVIVGDLKFEIFHCPGHCPGSVALFERKERVLFTGDVLFAGTIGRTDLPGGNFEQLLTSIRQQLLPLGDDVKVYAGHGPVTTIGQERRTNQFLIR